LIEGLPSVLLAFVTLAYLPDGPAKALWLTADEKEWLTNRLEQENAGNLGQRHDSTSAALSSGRVWTFAGIYFAIVMSFYGVTFWLPQIVKAFSGMSDFFVGCIAAIPWIAATVCMILNSKHSDITRERRWHVALSAAAGAAGLITAGVTTNPAVELTALSVAAAGIWGTLGPFWAMSSESLTGTGAAAGIALINSVGNLGGFAGPYLIGFVRTHTNSFMWGLVVLALSLIAGAVVTLATRQPSLRIASAVKLPSTEGR
jgi:ACS family tartrate transporter-like MFS transporter